MEKNKSIKSKRGRPRKYKTTEEARMAIKRQQKAYYLKHYKPKKRKPRKFATQGEWYRNKRVGKFKKFIANILSISNRLNISEKGIQKIKDIKYGPGGIRKAKVIIFDILVSENNQG